MTATAARHAAEAPSPAVAPPPGNPRFALFDGLRAVAVLAVVVFHVALISGALTGSVRGNAAQALGLEGPILFFVISGFLLYRPFVAARARGVAVPSVARYARRRALRVVPAYWLALVVLGVTTGLVGVFSSDWWRYFFFLQLYSERTLGHGLAVAWTLCVEVSFYVTLPLWAFAVRRVAPGPGPRGWLRAELAPLALLAIAGIVVQVEAGRQDLPYVVGQSLAGQCVWLALGMGLAVASVAAVGGRPPALVEALAARPARCWAGAAAAFAGVVALVPAGGLFGLAAAPTAHVAVTHTLARAALTAVLLGLLVLPAVFGEDRGGAPRRLLGWAPVAWLGLVSYGAYLWHLPLAELIGLRGDPYHFSAPGLGLVDDLPAPKTLVLLALVMAATLVVAAASYYLVELRFLRRKER